MRTTRLGPATVRAAAAAFCLLAAASATALSEAELLVAAEANLADFEDLEDLIAACPDGVCPTATQILSDLDAASAELEQLHVEREAIGSCGCVEVDAALEASDTLDADLRHQVEAWPS